MSINAPVIKIDPKLAKEFAAKTISMTKISGAKVGKKKPLIPKSYENSNQH